MAETVLTGRQVKDGSIQKKDLDITTTGQAVITRIAAGTGINLSASTGVDSGTGVVTIDCTVTAGLTTLNTLTASTQTFATGTSGTDFGIVSATSTHTFNLPDASATARGLITIGVQTINGSKTFSGATTTVVNLNLTGTTITGATSSDITLQSVTNGNGVKLVAPGSASFVSFVLNGNDIWRIQSSNSGMVSQQANTRGDIYSICTTAGSTTGIRISGGQAGPGFGGQIYLSSTVNTATAGGVELRTGANASLQSSILLNVNNGSGEIYFGTNGTNNWKFAAATGGFKFLNALGTISANTADAADTGRLSIQAGGLDTSNQVTRGAWIDMYGNEHAGTGVLWLGSGDVSGGRVRLYTFGAQPIEIFTAGALRWSFDSSGVETFKSYGTTSYTTSTGKVSQNAVVNTTTSADTVLASFALADNTTYNFSIQISGRLNSTTAKGVTGQLRFGIYRNNAGAPVVVGTRLRELDSYGSSGYTFDINILSNSVRIMVTGATGETVSWIGQIDYLGVSTST